MAAAGPDAPAPEPATLEPPAPAPLPADMHVERRRLDDGRALLLFTWDDPA